MELPPNTTAATYELVPFDERQLGRRRRKVIFVSCLLGLSMFAAFGAFRLLRSRSGEPANLRIWSDVAANRASQIPTSDGAESHVQAAGVDVDEAPFVLKSSNELQPTPMMEELRPNDVLPAAVDDGDEWRSSSNDDDEDSFRLGTGDAVLNGQLSIGVPRLGHENIVFANTKLQEAIRRAERGALFSSRAMLIETLRDVCRMLDATSGGQRYSTALVSALTALDEADDFQYRGVHAEADLETDGFIAGHDTQVLKGRKRVSSLRARDAYYNHARDQLTEACCGQAVAAKACYALGRVETMMRSQRPTTRRGGPREIPLFQASLNVNPQDHVAANELGVALARAGHLRRAAQTLDSSIQLKPDATAMSNLAKVYQQLGNPQRAASLQRQIAGGRSAPVQQVASQVQLVSVDEFGNQRVNRAGSTDSMHTGASFVPTHAAMPVRAGVNQPQSNASSPTAPNPSGGMRRSLWGTYQHANPIPRN